MITLGPAGSAHAREYGYLISDDAACSVWWAEGVYKIMKNDPVPLSKKEIVVHSALNEYEPFQIVLRPKRRLDNIRVEVSGMPGAYGFYIPGEDISVCRVGYVEVMAPTDTAGRAGWWPDPLIPCDGPFTVYPGENSPLWLTVHLRLGATWGPYQGTIKIYSDDWGVEFPLRVEARSFTLPEESHVSAAISVWPENIRKYHNLETDEEYDRVLDMYMQNYKEHRITPYSHSGHYPIQYEFDGIYWRGGTFVTDNVFRGGHAGLVRDMSPTSDPGLTYAENIPAVPGTQYTLTWAARTDEADREYTVLVQAFDAGGNWLASQNKLRTFKGGSGWKEEKFTIEPGFHNDARSLSVTFFPVFRTENGRNTGTAFFDEIKMVQGTSNENLILNGGFEANVASLGVRCDFTRFDTGMGKYLDVFGFRDFRLELAGISSPFGGYMPGSPEHEHLFGEYLSQVQDHLEEKGWLGKEYIYWKDEPTEEEYDWVRAGMERIHRAAPKLRRMLTEEPQPGLYGAVDLWCPVLHYYDPERGKERMAQGEEFWWYLCTGPKAPWITLFIDHDDINLRMWLWMTYKYNIKGILVWNSTWWNSTTLFPEGVLQNPWKDPMSYRMGYGTPFGQVRHWGNGDGRFLYPPNMDPNTDKTKYMTGPYNSIRWEMIRDGIEDYEYLWLLEQAVKDAGPDKQKVAEEAKKLLDLPESLIKDRKIYNKDPKALLEYREKVGNMLNRLIGEFY